MINGFQIGLSGLRVAQQGIEVVGTNISNVSTDGYHRQNMSIATQNINVLDGVAIGGAQVEDVRRNMSHMIESELLRQDPLMGGIQQKLQTLQSVESAFGDIDSDGLAESIRKMFAAFRELTAQPENNALQEQAVWASDGVASQMRNLGQFFADLRSRMRNESETYVHKINELAGEVAHLNEEIRQIEAEAGNANVVMDRRDQAIRELAELAPVTTHSSADSQSIVNVSVWGTPIVVVNRKMELEVGRTGPDTIGIASKGSNFYQQDVTGGKAGALIDMYNTTIKDLSNSLDTLAQTLITRINRLHVNGVGTAGSFTEKVGFQTPTGTIGEWSDAVQAGSFFVRVTDQSTGDVVRHEISVDPDTETVEDIAAKLNAVPGLQATSPDRILRIQSDAGYEFDFLPAVSASPDSSTMTGTASAEISGLYTGQDNQEYTVSFIGTGTVGQGSLKARIYNGAGDVVATRNIGEGYIAGDKLELGDGLEFAVSAGTINDSEQFTVDAFADTDPTGFLAATGINVLFTGNTATSMRMHQEMLENPAALGLMLDPRLSDNRNAMLLGELGQQPLEELGGVAPEASFRQMSVRVAQQIEINKSRSESTRNIMQQLEAHRDQISGVDINNETAEMILFERMFQAMAKYMNTQSKVMDSLLDLL
ncbi:MAG: flagellar hook-associated protein FlgK [Phycisphaerae bacterium]